MNTEVVVAYAGEPRSWLDEIPEAVKVTVYDTGLRVSKHGPQAMAERRFGASLNEIISPHGMPTHQLQWYQPFRTTQQLADTAKRGADMIENGRRQLQLVRDTCDLTLQQAHLTPHTRAVEWIQTQNDAQLRESAHWLRHIIDRFDSLADITFFVHGWPFDHCKDMVEQIRFCDAIVPSYYGFALLPFQKDKRPSGDPPLTPKVEQLLKFIGDDSDPSQTVWSAGTQFTAGRQVLQAPGKQFWIDLLREARAIGPRSAEALERVYYAVLSHCSGLTVAR